LVEDLFAFGGIAGFVGREHQSGEQQSADTEAKS
jgi:hypothetical protein